jgi:hypothetical protein
MQRENAISACLFMFVFEVLVEAKPQVRGHYPIGPLRSA